MPSPTPSSSQAWILINGVLVLMLLCGGGYLIAVNEEAAEVASEAFWGVFTFFTTPFILESSLAIGALLAVGIINQRRIEREGDGWVLMPRNDEETPVASQEKHGSTLE
jgi:hypothetical protein